MRDLLEMSGEEAALELVSRVTSGDLRESLIAVNEVVSEGADLRQLHRGAVEYLRAALLLKTGANDSLGYPDSTIDQLRPLADGASVRHLVHTLKIFSQGRSAPGSGIAAAPGAGRRGGLLRPRVACGAEDAPGRVGNRGRSRIILQAPTTRPGAPGAGRKASPALRRAGRGAVGGGRRRASRRPIGPGRSMELRHQGAPARGQAVQAGGRCFKAARTGTCPATSSH